MDEIQTEWSEQPNVVCVSLVKCVVKHGVSLVWCGVSGWLRAWAMMRCFSIRRREGHWWCTRWKPPQRSRPFREQIQHFWEYVVVCFERLMLSFSFLNVASDFSCSFGFVDHSSFYYNSKYRHIFYTSTKLLPLLQGCSMSSFPPKTHMFINLAQQI